MQGTDRGHCFCSYISSVACLLGAAQGAGLRIIEPAAAAMQRAAALTLEAAALANDPEHV
jgi:hypothetical protein